MDCNSHLFRKNVIILKFHIILLVITYNSLFAQNVATPEFSYETGKYNHAISVKIFCDTPDATIFYTTDGTTPDTDSQKYSNIPILVSEHVAGDSVTLTSDNDPDAIDENTPLRYRSMTLKAVAINGNNEKSGVATVNYTIDLVDGSFNIPYDEPPLEGGSKHQLDIYQPVGEKNTPVLLFIHGGAWKQGDKNIYMELGNTLAGYYGITTVIANYELSSDPWNAVHPDHVLDVASAFAWVYEQISEYGGDPENIYLFGQSAGGHLVSLLSTDSNYLQAHNLTIDKIKGVISMSGAYELYDLVAWPNNPNGLDAAAVLEYKVLCNIAFNGWEKGLLDSASPQQFIKPTQPPFRIIALNETDTFLDMPGFSQQANNFYSAIIGLNQPFAELKILNENDIPAKVYEMDFPGNTDGHYQEIYAINTRDWNSRSSVLVSEYLQVYPETPQLQTPENGKTEPAPNTVLEWRDTKNTLYYHLQLSENQSFSGDSLIFDSPIADTSWAIDLSSQKTYFWRVKAVNRLTESPWSEEWQFSTSSPTDVKKTPEITPQTAMMMNLYPNPFNGVLRLQIKVPGNNIKQSGSIKIFDMLGRQVYYKKVDINLERTDLFWEPGILSSGLYFVNISVGALSLSQKVMYVK